MNQQLTTRYTGNDNRRRSAGLPQYSKLPPQAVELEEAVLSAILIERDALSKVIGVLSVDAFYKPAHQAIYETMLALYGQGEPIDLLMVMQEGRKIGTYEQFGAAYLAELTSKVTSSANIEYHARILHEMYAKRSMITELTKIASDAYEDSQDAFDLLERVGRFAFELGQIGYTGSGRIETMTEIVERRLEWYETVRGLEPGKMIGVPVGLDAFDKVLLGLRDTDLIYLGARPGMGKTALLLAMGRNSAKLGYGCGLFMLEMSADQSADRIGAQESEVNGLQFRDPRKMGDSYATVKAAMKDLSGLPIWVDDTAGLDITAFRTKAREMVRRGAKWIGIDYVQLMTVMGHKGNRTTEMGFISRTLKQTAKELGVPVVGLVQLSRGVESRGGDKRPELSDMRDSGEFEQDADAVGFLYRPWYYDIKEDEQGNSTFRDAELIWRKNRHGKLGPMPMSFYEEFTDFRNPEDPDFIVDPAGDPDPNDKPSKPYGSLPMTSKMNGDDDIPF